MAPKRIRRNYFKNSPARKGVKTLGRLVLALKVFAGTAAVAVMSFGFIFAHDLLTQSDFFRAATIQIDGLVRLAPEEILRQAALTPEVNIFAINLTTTRKRLLAHPWVAEAEVSREIPSGLRLRIREQVPLAIIDLNRRFLLNTQGDIFKEWSATDPTDLPVVCGLDFSDLNPGATSFSAPFKAVMGVLDLGRKPGSVLPNHEIKRIQVDREIGLTVLAFDQPRTIKLGFDDYTSKYRRLKSILTYLRQTRVVPDFDSIDLNNLERVVITPVGAVSPPTVHKEV